jgi:DNA-binding Lrp family transcriptional regulator
MQEIDKFDMRFLVELEKDSRQPISNIAKILKTSQQVLSYRLIHLQKKQIILGFYTVINFVKLGYTSYRTMIRLTNISPETQQKIIDYLKKSQNVSYLAECTGHWDLIVDYLAKNVVQYYSFLKEIRANFPDNLGEIDVLTTLENIYFGRDYFAKKYREITKKILY